MRVRLRLLHGLTQPLTPFTFSPRLSFGSLIKNHGRDWYIFSVIALNELNVADLKSKVEGEAVVSKSQILEAIDGKVVGWGEWIGEVRE